MKHFNILDLQQYEALNLLCGHLLGVGVHRKVFRHAFNEKLVVKVATNSEGIRANFCELETFDWIKENEKYKHYFAAVDQLSSQGTILIQEYIPDLPAGSYKLPSFFTDLKRENFGLVRGTDGSQIVCRDYGIHLLIRDVGKPVRMVNVEFKE